MPRYHVDNRMAGSQQALAAAFKTGVTLFNSSGGTAWGGRLVSIAVGLDGAPNATDTQIVFDVQRLTATGTGTLTTPNALRNPAALAAAPRNLSMTNLTTEPTYTANTALWLRVLNQRASMQWAGQDQDAYPEWIGVANTAGAIPNGVGLRGSGGATPVTANPNTALEFDE